jgi:hypothetical protein
MIIGLLMSIVGLGEVDFISCNGPMAPVGQASNYQCPPTPQQQMSFIILYVGIVIVFSGVWLVVKPLVSKPTNFTNTESFRK